jgi:hypothetical protein
MIDEKDKLRCLVAANIILIATETILKLRLYGRIKCGMMLMTLYNLFGTVYSYRKTEARGGGQLSIHVAACLCILSSFFGLYAVYHGIGPASFLTLFNFQTFIFFALMLLFAQRHFTLLQFGGLLAILLGCTGEIFCIFLRKSSKLAASFALLSAFFSAGGSALFEIKIRPHTESMWNFMLMFSASSTLFSLVLLIHEACSFGSDYLAALESPQFYALMAAGLALSYLTSRISSLIDISERSTLANVGTAVGFMAAEISIYKGIEVTTFLNFFVVVVGVQLFNFFAKE